MSLPDLLTNIFCRGEGGGGGFFFFFVFFFGHSLEDAKRPKAQNASQPLKYFWRGKKKKKKKKKAGSNGRTAVKTAIEYAPGPRACRGDPR